VLAEHSSHAVLVSLGYLIGLLESGVLLLSPSGELLLVMRLYGGLVLRMLGAKSTNPLELGLE
jgi:hypothetical protein